MILYHKNSDNDKHSKSPNEITPTLQSTLNTFLSLHLQSPTEKRIPIPNQKTLTTSSSLSNINATSSASLTSLASVPSASSSPQTISEWAANDDYMIVVLYSRVVLEQNAGGLGMNWIQNSLLQDLMKEFILFKTHVGDNSSTDAGNSTSSGTSTALLEQCHLFNATFDAIYKRCESRGRMDKLNNNYTTNTNKSSNYNKSNANTTATTSKKNKGKEDRVWHDREQKVTSKTMAKLDRSKKDHTNENDDPMFISDSSPALIEARAAYLPSEDEVPSWEQEEKLIDDDVDDDQNEGSSGWGSSLKGMMDQFSGKVLTDQDLDLPLEDMEKMLTSKNVAREIAKDICLTVRKKLVGKRMASFTRVKTAVRQALEIAIEKILRPGKGRGGGEEVDLLRNVVSKRESGRMGKIFGGSNRSSAEGKRPYVIVMGKLSTIVLHFWAFRVLLCIYTQ